MTGTGSVFKLLTVIFYMEHRVVCRYGLPGFGKCFLGS